MFGILRSQLSPTVSIASRFRFEDSSVGHRRIHQFPTQIIYADTHRLRFRVYTFDVTLPTTSCFLSRTTTTPSLKIIAPTLRLQTTTWASDPSNPRFRSRYPTRGNSYEFTTTSLGAAAESALPKLCRQHLSRWQLETNMNGVSHGHDLRERALEYCSNPGGGGNPSVSSVRGTLWASCFS